MALRHLPRPRASLPGLVAVILAKGKKVDSPRLQFPSDFLLETFVFLCPDVGVCDYCARALLPFCFIPRTQQYLNSESQKAGVCDKHKISP